ncbi:hypothetical protein [Halobacterium wangiae]|uniref:hypothetical protein n=1 Tax=Halobacterium wangiae TaxID=2902623 RepID=UPI001E35A603|nr:hypothetical protein [Halobacterium wangiae]
MFDKPSYLVQMGWQGKNRIQFGADQEYIDGAVLSPSDYIDDSLEDTSDQLSEAELHTLFDPQFYLPSQGDRDKLNRYDYHDNYGGDDFYNGLFYNEEDRESFFEDLIDLQDNLSCDAYVSPSRHISSLSADEVDDWKQRTEFFVEKARDYGEEIPIFATIAVSGKHLTDDSLRDYLLNIATSLDVDGFYVSVMYEDADSSLPLTGERNVESYLKTLLVLKLNRYEVIAGSTHQIAHLLFAVGVDAFCSGHFNNLRSFDTDRWVVPDDPAPRQRVTRYYSDELLTDVRPDHLMTEVAENTEIDVSILQSASTSTWEDNLFDSGSINAGWPESEGGWDHYTFSCGKIAEQYRGLGKEARVDHASKKIRKAKALNRKLKTNIDKFTDELDDGFLEDWESALEKVTSSPEFKRL